MLNFTNKTKLKTSKMLASPKGGPYSTGLVISKGWTIMRRIMQLTLLATSKGLNMRDIPQPTMMLICCSWARALRNHMRSGLVRVLCFSFACDDHDILFNLKSVSNIYGGFTLSSIKSFANVPSVSTACYFPSFIRSSILTFFSKLAEEEMPLCFH